MGADNYLDAHRRWIQVGSVELQRMNTNESSRIGAKRSACGGLASLSNHGSVVRSLEAVGRPGKGAILQAVPFGSNFRYPEHYGHERQNRGR
jgi:hypothetical protein